MRVASSFGNLANALTIRTANSLVLSCSCLARWRVVMPIVKSLNRRIVNSFSCGRSLLCLEISRDQAGAFIERQIRPRPLKQHYESIPETDEKNDVHKKPGEPRRHSDQ